MKVCPYIPFSAGLLILIYVNMLDSAHFLVDNPLTVLSTNLNPSLHAAQLKQSMYYLQLSISMIQLFPKK